MLRLCCICALVLIPESKGVKIGHNWTRSYGKKIIISHFLVFLKLETLAMKKLQVFLRYSKVNNTLFCFLLLSSRISGGFND